MANIVSVVIVAIQWKQSNEWCPNLIRNYSAWFVGYQLKFDGADEHCRAHEIVRFTILANVQCCVRWARSHAGDGLDYARKTTIIQTQIEIDIQIDKCLSCYCTRAPVHSVSYVAAADAWAFGSVVLCQKWKQFRSHCRRKEVTWANKRKWSVFDWKGRCNSKWEMAMRLQKW